MAAVARTHFEEPLETVCHLAAFETQCNVIWLAREECLRTALAGRDDNPHRRAQMLAGFAENVYFQHGMVSNNSLERLVINKATDTADRLHEYTPLPRDLCKCIAAYTVWVAPETIHAFLTPILRTHRIVTDGLLIKIPPASSAPNRFAAILALMGGETQEALDKREIEQTYTRVSERIDTPYLGIMRALAPLFKALPQIIEEQVKMAPAPFAFEGESNPHKAALLMHERAAIHLINATYSQCAREQLGSAKETLEATLTSLIASSQEISSSFARRFQLPLLKGLAARQAPVAPERYAAADTSLETSFFSAFSLIQNRVI